MPRRSTRLHFRKLENGEVILLNDNPNSVEDDAIEVVTRGGKRKLIFDDEDQPVEVDVPPLVELNPPNSNVQKDEFDPLEQTYIDFCTLVIGEEKLSRKQRKLLRGYCKEVIQEQPSALKLLTSNIFHSDKLKLLEMLRVLKDKDQDSEDYLDYKKVYQTKFESAQRNFDELLSLPPDLQRSHTEEKDRIDKLAQKKSFSFQIINLPVDDETKRFIYQRYIHYERMGNSDDEKPKLEQWLNTVLQIPYKVFIDLPSEREVCLRNFRDILDREIYGMQAVKEQLLVFLNTKLTNPHVQGSNLALLGPPGVGKTKIARLMAKALNLPFAQVPCGGLESIDRIRGHSYTYIGSQPGEITSAVLSMKANNGVMFFDEFEKIGSEKAHLTNSLYNIFLHILDPEQNGNFHDDYLGLEIPIDLSRMWFILAMNSLPNFQPLIDRLYVVQVPAYTIREKIIIAQRHLIPEIFAALKLDQNSIIFTDEIISRIIHHFNLSSIPGLRQLKNILREIVLKIHFLQTSNLQISFQLKNMKLPYKLQEEDLDKLQLNVSKEDRPSMWT